MKYTLLELTQSVLSSMDSDEVNSINDTPESQQVVEIIKTVYDDLITRSDIKVNNTLFNLVASNDIVKPVLMTKPDNIDHIHWIKYNRILNGDVDPIWDEMLYLSVNDFMEYTHQLKPSNTNVDSFDLVQDGFVFTFMYRNDWSPQYYTSFDDNTLIFDGYDNAVSTTLESSKTLCYGSKISSFSRADSFIPDLQPQQFALLLNEAKSLAWSELKQTVHHKAEQSARRNWTHIQKARMNTPRENSTNGAHSFDKFRNFGRQR